MNIKRTILLSAAVGVAAVTGMPGASANGTTYRAPYQVGPTGGIEGEERADNFFSSGQESTYLSVDPNAGKVTVLSSSIVPGAIGCGSTGAMGYLRVQHPANGTEDKVLFTYKDASLTPYSWLKVNVRAPIDGVDTGIGSIAIRGQKVAETGTIVVPLDDEDIDEGGLMTIDFGIESGSACPHADGGTVTFPTVAVN